MRRIKSILRQWLPVAVAITTLSGLVYLEVQQVLRQDANDPQIQMAKDAAAVLARDGTIESVLPTTPVDLEQSIAPFITVFDETGAPLASSGQLHGQMPTVSVAYLTMLAGMEKIGSHGNQSPECGMRLW
jgi:hypothetical protein